MDNSEGVEVIASEDEMTPPNSIQGLNGSRSSSHGSQDGPHPDHVINLSSIEDVMPRAYIRICLAYRTSSDLQQETALKGLQEFIRKTVMAKPYLAGNVIDVDSPKEYAGRAEVRFTMNDYKNYPRVEEFHLTNEDGSSINYDELDEAGLPPSRLRPENMSFLPPNADPKVKSPVLRVRACMVQGGLIISIYLHHCISDGTGFDLITSGRLQNDFFAFPWATEAGNGGPVELEARLKDFAARKSEIRQSLSTYRANLKMTREIKAKHRTGPTLPTNEPGRGCVFFLDGEKIRKTVKQFTELSTSSNIHHTTNSVIMAILWRHMTLARRSSIDQESIKTSKLFIPVNIRNRMVPPLPEGYFGAAVDSGIAKLNIDTLTSTAPETLLQTSQTIRAAIDSVDDNWVRQMISYANKADSDTDVSDIQGSGMDRVHGADMYITSWLKLGSYQHDLGMGLGGPDWVRKPWSRDPGSCIILPERSKTPEFYEVVSQMTTADMERLLQDEEFKEFVIRVID